MGSEERVFSALADPMRRSLLADLAEASPKTAIWGAVGKASIDSVQLPRGVERRVSNSPALV